MSLSFTVFTSWSGTKQDPTDMMGVLDFDAVFDVLDPARRGTLGVDQIHMFDGTLHFTPLAADQVKASVHWICGKNSQGNVKKEDFAKVCHL